MHATISRFTPGAGRRRAFALSGVTALALAALPTLAAAAPGATSAASAASAVTAATAATPVPASLDHVLFRSGKTAPVSTTKCETTYAYACYSPVQYRTAYDLNSLYAKGITGAGRTIVIVDAFGSPTIQADLDT